MRIRHKPGAYPELCASPLFVKDPESCLGAWNKLFCHPDAPFFVELGCGKGGFAAEFCARNRDKNLLAVDIKSEVLMLAKRKGERAFDGKPADNLLITAFDIERINFILAPNDCAQGIFINFCNPWYKNKQKKKRLTHTRQLIKYRSFLVDGGVVEIKTDDEALFNDSLEYLALAGYETTTVSRDIYADGLSESLIPTEHEIQFREDKLPIFYIKATKKAV